MICGQPLRVGKTNLQRTNLHRKEASAGFGATGESGAVARPFLARQSRNQNVQQLTPLAA